MYFFTSKNTCNSNGQRQRLANCKLKLLFLAIFGLVSFNLSAQRITLDVKDARIKDVLEQIRVQSGYQVFYNDAFLEKAKPVTLKFSDATLNQILSACFEDQPLTFEIVKKTIVIKPAVKPVSGLAHSDPSLQIQGLVKDPQGLPLENVTVQNPSNKTFTKTDVDGNFIIRLEKKGPLIFSYVGFGTQTISVDKSNNNLIVTMEVKVSGLDQVQVIGYGRTTQRLSTGNVSTLDAKDIATQPASNVLGALQGRIAGMVVKPTNGFFSANYGIKVRGTNSLSTSPLPNSVSDPLYIVDGLPVTTGNGDQAGKGVNQNSLNGPAGGQNPLLWLNPSDILSISVLKDADATAIYGARGANGVILITTKKPKAGDTKIDINAFSGYTLRPKELTLLNTAQYLEMRKEAFKNDGITPDAGSAPDLLAWDPDRYTNWQKELLRTARSSDMQLGLNGGDAKTSFRFNTGYHEETPPFQGDFSDRRISSQLSLNYSELDGKFNADFNINVASIKSDLPQTDITNQIFTAPNAPAFFNSLGQLNFDGWRDAGGLPYSITALKEPYKANTLNFISNLLINYKFSNNFVVSLSGGINVTRQNQLNINSSAAQDPANPPFRTTIFGNNNSDTWIFEPTLNWSKRLDAKNKLEVLLGATYQNSVISGNQITASGFVTDAQMEDQAAAAAFTNAQSNYAQTRIQSLYARFIYNFSDKYIISLNGRRDGSSRFGPGNQFGNFGSVGAAWIFTEEPFLKNTLPFLSFGKLRGSYGITGGDAVGDYAYLSAFKNGNNPYQGTPVLQLNQAGNPNYKWTVNKKLDLSLNLGFLEDRILLNASYYRNRSGNQLVSYPLPSFTGVSAVVNNLPALIRNNGLEFELTTRNLAGSSFNWTTSANLSISRNKLLAFPDLANSSYNYIYTIGQSISRQELFHFAGINPATGKIIFQDKNNDGVIDYQTDQDYYNAEPSFSGGMQNSLTYKNFSLSFFIIFVKTKGLQNAYNQEPGYFNSNEPVSVLKRWQKNGDITNIAAFSTNYGQDQDTYLSSDALWGDASYIRLQDVSLSYSLPPAVWHFKGAPKTILSVQGENILTISGYKGTDPAIPTSGVGLPARRLLTARVQLIF